MQSLKFIISNSFFSSFLGYSRSIPGNPRYTVLGNDGNGEFSLQITDVQLEDDADYECQVGPALYNQPIRHKAHLTVQCKCLVCSGSLLVWVQ